MSKNFDAIVVGLGMAGAATLFELARRGHRVLGLERFTAPNQLASHHGGTRIFRMAYAEHPCYVPLLRSAQQGWREAESLSGEPLLMSTGSIHAGPEDSLEYTGAAAACRDHGLMHELLDARTLQERVPGLRLPEGYRAVLQPDGGILAAERSVAAFLSLAVQHGAQARYEEPVCSFDASVSDVRVNTSAGRYSAATVVLCAGAWMRSLVPELTDKLQVVRQVVGWFEAPSDHFRPERFPVFTIDTAVGPMFGFPSLDRQGLKIGRHQHLHEVVDPGTVQRSVSAADEQVMREALVRYLPGANGTMLASGVGVYTNTQDEFFILDRLPRADNVVLASPCSGHGFKFMPVLGQILADLAERRPAAHDISAFRLDRFDRFDRLNAAQEGLT